jgi:hypothetical protein
VLGGSATEALLLSAIQNAERQKEGTVQAAVAALMIAKVLAQKPNPDPERWSFIQLIEAAL